MAESVPTQEPRTTSKKARMRAVKIGTTLGVAVLLIGGGWVYFSSSDATVQPQEVAQETLPSPALTITVTRSETMSMPIFLKASGNVEAWQEASIGSDVSDLRLTNVFVNVGDKVKKGAVLAQFDRKPVEIAFAKAQGELKLAKASLSEASENAKRARGLAHTGAMSRQLVTQYLTQEQTARAQVAVAQADVDSEALRLSRTTVESPDFGTISARTATVGAVVSAGGELFRLVRQNKLEWRAQLTAEELAQVKVGDRVEILFDGETLISAQVRTVAPTVDTSTRLGYAYVDLPSDSVLRPGAFVSGTFILGESTAVALPQKAVVLRDAYSYVFEVDEKGYVHQKKVTTGRLYGNYVEVVSGLDVNARVAYEGAGFLSDGDFVRVEQASADEKNR